MSDLYNRDIVTWNEPQAALLRRRPVGELVNEAELDRENIAEEIESVGRGDLHAVTSWLMREPRHDPRPRAWP